MLLLTSFISSTFVWSTKWTGYRCTSYRPTGEFFRLVFIKSRIKTRLCYLSVTIHICFSLVKSISSAFLELEMHCGVGYLEIFPDFCQINVEYLAPGLSRIVRVSALILVENYAVLHSLGLVGLLWCIALWVIHILYYYIPWIVGKNVRCFSWNLMHPWRVWNVEPCSIICSLAAFEEGMAALCMHIYIYIWRIASEVYYITVVI